MRTPVLIFLMALLWPINSRAQQHVADSLTALVQRLPDGPEKIDVLGQLTRLYLSTDLAKAAAYGFQQMRLGQKTRNRLAVATAYKDMGVIHLIGSAFDSSQYYSRLAQEGYEQLLAEGGGDAPKIREGYAGTIANIGNWHYYQGALDSAVVYHQQAIAFCRKWGIEKPKANSLGTLAYIFLDQSKYEQALAMHLEALRTFEKLDNPEGVSRSYQGIGEINCEYLGKCELAIDYYRKALAIKESLGSERGMAYVFKLLGGAYNILMVVDSADHYYEKAVTLAEKLNDKRLLVDVYSAMTALAQVAGKSEDEELALNLKYIQIAEEIGRLDGLFVGYSVLGDIYRRRGDHARAIAYYNKAIPLAEAQKNYKFLEKVHYKRYKIFKMGLSDHAGALSALEAYLVAHDSVTNAQKFKAVEELSAQYETEKKEATIAQQQEAIRQGQLRFWLITALLGIALAAGATLYGLTRRLRQRNAEKEVLIKEVHHRVKNNLQVLSSLLHLQARHIKDETALDAIREGQNRVESMSLIHQKLYMGDNLVAVDMASYLRNLGDNLLDAYRLDDGHIAIHYDVAPLHLDVDTAIPLGLIINELVTNALKYAFPNRREGAITIGLWKNEEGKLCLKVADNGVGKAAAPALKSSTSFGSSLVDMLSQKLKGVPVDQQTAEGVVKVFAFSNYKEALYPPKKP
jgi:two-component sensor histidine kinase